MLKRILHYYGDTVRRLFVLAAVIMVVTLPFFIKQISEPLSVSLAAILITGMAAGLTSPRHGWTAGMNVLVSTIGVLIFEWHAVDWYARYEAADNYFWTNQLLAVIFLLALYYSLKTVRRSGGLKLNKDVREEDNFWDRSSEADGDGD